MSDPLPFMALRQSQTVRNGAFSHKIYYNAQAWDIRILKQILKLYHWLKIFKIFAESVNFA